MVGSVSEDAAVQEDGNRHLVDAERRRGRGTRSNVSGRFEAETRETIDDGWESGADLPAFKTTIHPETARTVITRNDSPDISFDQSVNPYRGCEHGCTYCYARPTHCYLGHSAGLDFETQLYAKPNAAELLEAELAKSSYKPATIALGTNTDPYQPIERQMGITRQILEVLEAACHPVAIVTKSALVLRDQDILSRMADNGLVKVALSVTTLDRRLARAMEPRASTPCKRLQAVAVLSAAGSVWVAFCQNPSVKEAGYVMLRLPLEIKELFREWLATDYPDRSNRVIKLVKDMHDGRDYRSEFGLRQKGSGPYAAQVAMRFRLALKRLGLNECREQLRTDLFRSPATKSGQLSLI